MTASSAERAAGGAGGRLAFSRPVSRRAFGFHVIRSVGFDSRLRRVAAPDGPKPKENNRYITAVIVTVQRPMAVTRTISLPQMTIRDTHIAHLEPYGLAADAKMRPRPTPAVRV